MFRVSRLLAPVSVAAAFAVAAPAAHAGTTTLTFPDSGPVTTTVTMTDPGAASNSVHLDVTAADPTKLAATHVYLGASQPWYAVGLDGIHQALYDGNGDLASPGCSPSTARTPSTSRSITAGPASLPTCRRASSSPSPTSTSPSASRASTRRATAPASPASPSTTSTPRRRSTASRGTCPPPRRSPPLPVAAARSRSASTRTRARSTTSTGSSTASGRSTRRTCAGTATTSRSSSTSSPTAAPLDPGTAYAFQVQATRLFMPDRVLGDYLVGPFSALTPVTTAAVQTVAFSATPAASTTARSALFSWTISANDAGDAPFCVLDATETSGTEIPCTVTGATIDGLAVGAHTLSVYPADGEAVYTHSWAVTDLPTTPPPAPVSPPAPTPPVNTIDLDGDGIDNSWLVGGKPAPAPRAPKASVTGKHRQARPRRRAQGRQEDARSTAPTARAATSSSRRSRPRARRSPTRPSSRVTRTSTRSSPSTPRASRAKPPRP